MTRPQQAPPRVDPTTTGEPGDGTTGHAVATGDGGAETRRGRRGAVALSMGTWLAIALLGVTVTALLISSIVTMVQTSRLADGIVQARANALLNLQAGEVERYLGAARASTATLAATGTVRDAARRFGAAFAELEELSDSATDDAADLSGYYRDEVIPRLEDVTGENIGLRRLLPDSDAARYLQSRYTVPDPSSDLSPGELADAQDGSAWSAAHAELHPTLSELAAQLDFEDLYLIAPDTGTVIYSAGKATDFGTSLQAGPYSGSVLAQGLRDLRESDEGVVQTDVAPYAPAGGRPAGFVLTRVLGDGRLLAVLATKLPLDAIDDIMTVEGEWVDAGFGSTAETFLVGPDGRLRSVARAFVEDPDAYLQAVERAGTATTAERRAMDLTGTTVTFQQALTGTELAASLSDGTGLAELTSFLGRDVVAASRPVDVPGLDWAATVQVTREELAAPVAAYRGTTIVAVAAIVLFVSFVAVAWTRRTFRPITLLAERLRAIHVGHDTGHIAVGPRAPREFATLADSVDTMIAALDRQRAAVDAAIADRRATVRALLPAAVAARVDSGDRRVVDEITHASVVVATVNGLGLLVQHEDGMAGRELLDRTIRELDPLAAQHGLERVKILGDAYFAGCGLATPYLDHAPRAVAFAQAAHDTVRRITADEPVEVRLSIGIDSGPVTVGLTGSALLVFDMWGDTVAAAHVLAQRARPGETLVAERTHGLLPPEVAASPADQTGTAGTAAWRVAGAPAPESTT